ncbi:TPA: hypothetical protein ACQVH3_005092 [Serratia marcescens]
MTTREKVTITYDGEFLEISPVGISAITEVLRSLEKSETFATAGIDTSVISETPGDEFSGCLGVHTNYNHAIFFQVLDTVFRLSFPVCECARELMGISKDR